MQQLIATGIQLVYHGDLKVSLDSLYVFGGRLLGPEDWASLKIHDRKFPDVTTILFSRDAGTNKILDGTHNSLNDRIGLTFSLLPYQ